MTTYCNTAAAAADSWARQPNNILERYTSRRRRTGYGATMTVSPSHHHHHLNKNNTTCAQDCRKAVTLADRLFLPPRQSAKRRKLCTWLGLMVAMPVAFFAGPPLWRALRGVCRKRRPRRLSGADFFRIGTALMQNRSLPTVTKSVGCTEQISVTSKQILAQEQIISEQTRSRQHRRLKSSGGTSSSSAAICCVVKDEEAYIDEWVDYHIALGFESIYVYDNSDTFELRQWGNRSTTSSAGCGSATVKHWPGEGQQKYAYWDCALTYAQHHTWVAFFDVDEFLVLYQHGSVVDLLEQYLPAQHDTVPAISLTDNADQAESSWARRAGAVSINWRYFGTAHEVTYRPVPVTKRFQYHLPSVAHENHHVKSISRVADLDVSQSPVNAHWPILKALPRELLSTDSNITTYRQVDTSYREFQGPFNENGPWDVAALHHYGTKSHKEHIAKRVRGRVNGMEEDLIHNATVFAGPYGSIRNDDAWQRLKKLQPKYAIYDDIDQFSY